MSFNRGHFAVRSIVKVIQCRAGWRNLFNASCNGSEILHSRRENTMICHHPGLVPVRLYASKNFSKGMKKKGKVKVNDQALNEFTNVEKLRRTLQYTLDDMKEEYIKNLSLRTAGGSIETMRVNFEGTVYELQEIAQITRKGQKTIVIDMTTFPQVSKTVMDTLKKSSLNLNPQQEGTTIFVPIPKVTKEHREALGKKAKEIFVHSRDKLRKTQEKYIADLKNSHLSEHDEWSACDQVRALTDEYVENAEKMLKLKSEELVQ